MQKLKVHLKISSVANPSMAARCPNSDLPMIVGFLGIRRRPAGAPPVTVGPPADRRRGIARKFCHLQSESGGRRTVAWRWPADIRCLTFTTWFKVEKIRQWSADAKKQESAKNWGITAGFIKLVRWASNERWGAENFEINACPALIQGW